jgi:hypothetical protein
MHPYKSPREASVGAGPNVFVAKNTSPFDEQNIFGIVLLGHLITL